MTRPSYSVEVLGLDFSVELPRGQGWLSVDLLLDVWPPEEIGLRWIREGQDDEVATYSLVPRASGWLAFWIAAAANVLQAVAWWLS